MKYKMKKLIALLLAVLMIASIACMPAMAYTPATAAFSNTTELYDTEVPMLFAVKGTPTVDGKKDAAWDNALAISSDPASEKFDENAAFQSIVDYYMMWDDTNLYILEDRKDETIENFVATEERPDPIGYASYDCTTYNILMPSNIKTENIPTETINGKTYNIVAGAAHIGTIPSNSITNSSVANATGNSKVWTREMKYTGDNDFAYKTWDYTATFTSKTTKTATGYMIESAIPWSLLGEYNKDQFVAEMFQIFGLKIYNNAGKGGAHYHVNHNVYMENSTADRADYAGYAQVQLVDGNLTPDLSWYHADDHVYYIDDAADLFGLASLSQEGETFAGKTIKLTADIDLNPGWTANVSVNASTKAVTLSSAAPNAFPGLASFAGTLDGQGHTVKGIYMSKDNISWHYGLISTMTEGAIRNIAFTNSLIYSSTAKGNTSNFGIAGLIGAANVTDSKTIDIENVYVDIDVVNKRTDTNAKSMVGGLVGRVLNRTAAKAGDSGDIVYAQNVKNTVYAGTIVTANSSMIASQKVLNVAQLCAGGQFDGVTPSTGVTEIHGGWCFTNCVAIGTIYSGNSENYGEGKNDFVNLIEGVKTQGTALDANAFKSASKCESSTKADHSDSHTHLPWVYYKPSLAVDAFAYSETAKAVVPVTVAEMLDCDVTYVENTTGKTADTAWFNERGVYYISDAADLLGFSYLTRSWEAYKDIYGFESQEDITKGKTFYLTADIDLNPGWTAGTSGTNLNIFCGIATMYGTFDGQGHTISGIYNNKTMPSDVTSNYGLIGTLHTGGKVCNLVLKNGELIADADRTVGSVVGCVVGDNCVIENVYSDIAVTGADELAAGGLIGAVSGANLKLSNAVYLGNVTSAVGQVGDLIGQVGTDADVTVTDCVYAMAAYGLTAQNVTETRVLVKAEELADEDTFCATYADYDWAMVKGEIMMPVTVAEMLNYNVYVQESETPDTENGVTSLRILSTLDSLKWSEIGFAVTVFFADGREVTQEYTTDTVYTSITAAGGSVTAAELEGAYIYGLVIDNISLDRVFKIEVTPTKTTLNGTKVAMRSSTLYYQEGEALASANDNEAFVPEYTEGTLSSTYTLDGGKSGIKIYSGADDAAFEAYVEKLRDNGITDITEYTLENNRYALCKGAYNTVYVSYFATTNTMKVYSEVAGLNNYPEISTAQNYEQGYAKFWQISVDCLGAKKNGGMSYLFQAVDGTFIVIDGGYNTEAEADRLYKLMKDNVPAGDTPVIAAWYISHLHDDHIGGLMAFSDKYADEIDVQGFYYHFDYKGGAAASKSQMEEYMRRGLWDDAVHYGRLHTGMNFSIKGIKFEVFYTLEDLYPTTMVNYEFNNSSTVVRATVGAAERTIVFLGDIMKLASDCMLQNFTTASLQSDFVQFSHHGYEGATQAVYDAIKAPAVLWPMNVVGNQEKDYATVPHKVFAQWYLKQETLSSGEVRCNGYITQEADYVKQIIVSGMGTALVDLSVDPNTYTGSKLPDFEAYYEAHKSEATA